MRYDFWVIYTAYMRSVYHQFITWSPQFWLYKLQWYVYNDMLPTFTIQVPIYFVSLPTKLSGTWHNSIALTGFKSSISYHICHSHCYSTNKWSTYFILKNHQKMVQVIKFADILDALKFAIVNENCSNRNCTPGDKYPLRWTVQFSCWIKFILRWIMYTKG